MCCAVQHECIPQAILGMDVVCQAKSGMGKTAVFVLATLQQLEPVAGQVLLLSLFFLTLSTKLPRVKYYYYYFFKFDPRTQFPGNEKIMLSDTKKYKNQAGMNLTPPLSYSYYYNLFATRNAYKINQRIGVVCCQKRTVENTLCDKQ